MERSDFRRPLRALAGALLIAFSVLAAAEPPTRAARLGAIAGTVSFAPAGQPDWVQAVVNRPLTTGDGLWAGSDSRAELQIGGTAIRMGASTSLVLLNLDDRIAQVQLSQGTLKIRVRNMNSGQTVEVATPNLAFTLNRAGEYRIEVDPDADATTVMVESGDAEVYGEGASYAVAAQSGYRFFGTDLSDYDVVAMRPDDDLDRWSRERDRRDDNSISARYVSADVVGYEDLDANGTWHDDASYGHVWTPAHVASDWSPYRDGHWAWVDPWGWTWVDDATWGYAVSHYGRWANIRGSWAWVPGPRQERAVYAPALVAFVGGRNFQVSVSAGSAMPASVGWFPLAPREVYQPSYPVSRSYFDHINRSNAVVAPTALTRVYNTTIVNTTVVNNTTNIIYANQRVTGAVVAVPMQAFVQSKPVAKAAVKLAPATVASAPVVRFAQVAPVAQSLQGGAHEAVNRPPVHVRGVVARTAPPPAPVAFAAQQKQLAAKPGAPIDTAQRTRLEPAVPAAIPHGVSVVATAPVPKPTARPPATPPGGKSKEARKAAAAIADAPHGPKREPDAAKAPAAAAETADAGAAKAAAARAEALKSEAAKTAAAQAEANRAEAANVAAAKAERSKSDSAKALAAKVESERIDAAKAAKSKADAARAESDRADAARSAAAKGEAVKAESARAEQASAERSRAEAEKSKAEAARADASKVAAAKADTARAESARADAARSAAAQHEAAKAESARADAAHAQAKVEAAKAAAAAKAHASAPSPAARASGPKSDAESSPDDEKKKEARKP